MPVIKAVAYNFVTERCPGEVMALGINTIREVAKRIPAVLEEEGMDFLVQVQSMECTVDEAQTHVMSGSFCIAHKRCTGFSSSVYRGVYSYEWNVSLDQIPLLFLSRSECVTQPWHTHLKHGLYKKIYTLGRGCARLEKQNLPKLTS